MKTFEITVVNKRTGFTYSFSVKAESPGDARDAFFNYVHTKKIWKIISITEENVCNHR